MTNLFRKLLTRGSLLAAATLLSSCATGPRTMAPGAFSTVIIDAGHGGKDSGERSHAGLVEKDLTLDTALRLQPLLDQAGLHTVMTRTTDTFVELNDRVALANQYPNSILVSIHYNASPSSIPRGVETFFWRPDSYGLAIRVQRHLVEETALDNRGVTRRVLRLTYNPREPAILCECGFLTNASEAATVSDPEFRQRVAEALAAGIVDQQEHGDVGIGSLPPIVVTRTPTHHHGAHGHGSTRSHSTHASGKSSSGKSSSSGTHKRTAHHHQKPAAQN
jgi:N-acetylmuramoyl-L-alanine amidase